MRRGVALSVVLHVLVVAAGYVGLPKLHHDALITDTPIVVELVEVAERTNLPAPQPAPAAETRPKPPPPAPEVKAPPPPPEPEPVPVPEAPKVAAAPQPEPEPKAKPRPQTPLDNVRPARKPAPPDPFASVLKTVETLKSEPRPQPEPEKKPEPPKKDDFASEIAKVLAKAATPFDRSAPLTLSEIDAVRNQIAQCWNLPAGAKDAHQMTVDIAVIMNPDGYVREARIQGGGRLFEDSFYRAFSESALRAVLNRRCQPFKLPPEKFDQWKTMTLHFNPQEMFGL